jgi:surfeit locus 1 family protein
MRIRFRPIAGLSIASATLLVILVGLGVWQLERLQWKLALIASVQRHLTATPIPLVEALRQGPDAQYRRVVLDGEFENGKEAYVFATDASGNPAYHVLVPFKTERGVLVVDRGIVPPSLLDPAKRLRGQIAGPTRVVGVWRTPDAPGFFTPLSDRAHRIWYARDIKDIARSDAVQPIVPIVVEADATPNPGGWPKGGQTRITFRNEHLQYAITWIALAAVLLGVYIAYHVSKGRLKLRE